MASSRQSPVPHPDGNAFRPPPTISSGEDESNYWAVFWEVTDLAPLQPEAYIPIRMASKPKGHRFNPHFIPEGPHTPSWGRFPATCGQPCGPTDPLAQERLTI